MSECQRGQVGYIACAEESLVKYHKDCVHVWCFFFYQIIYDCCNFVIKDIFPKLCCLYYLLYLGITMHVCYVLKYNPG